MKRTLTPTPFSFSLYQRVCPHASPLINSPHFHHPLTPAFSFHFFHKSPIFLLPKTLRPITHLTMVASKFCFAFSLAILSILAVDAAQHHALAPSPSSPVDCSSLILNMADCLSFVSSGSKTSKPEGTCCSGLKTVLKAGPQCLCEAFKSSASLGVTLNVTKAMTLPAACKVSAPSATQCALSLSPTGAPGMAPSAIAGAPAAFSGGANEAAPAPSPGSSGSQVVSASMGSLILGFIIMLTSMY
ncbi:hypothetical protein ES288_A03G211500v1 [Gossypium darwinii]|uniref:Bifunctional inhibitor/plant lipid transfer protein/seed storage helical domain-containing protein n=1 Tax=Gossypium darwinii TaxID=34276 RepID=A0A5D2H7E3_GOSDA|nr:hypothetical protein ES288_A03G211500v1 [Gossypium darwinii]